MKTKYESVLKKKKYNKILVRKSKGEYVGKCILHAQYFHSSIFMYQVKLKVRNYFS